MIIKSLYKNGLATLILAVFILDSAPALSQWSLDRRYRVTDEGIFMGGMGLAFIEDETYFVLNLRTELSMGKFGVGVEVPLRLNTNNGELRNEDWNSTYDYFRVLRYIRYGYKHRTPIYARIGTLDTARLGHGFIMNYYTNEAQYDDRKIGLEFDLKFKLWGFESVVSNFERFEIVGGRAYVRPLRNTPNIGLLRKLTFGATIVMDDDPDGTRSTDDHVTIGGVDIELPLLYLGPFFSHIYADYAKIQNYGSGQALGIELGLWKLGGLFSMYAKLERRFLGKQFLPSYFDPFYENERFRQMPNGPIAKTDLLLQRTSKEQGIYGELFGHFLNYIKFLGTFERIDGQKDSGRLHLATLLSKSVARISARAVYDKTSIEDFEDAFTLDDRSIARIGLGYQVNPFFFIYMDYIWTFQFNETTQSLETQRRVEPQIAFVFPLNFGGK
ncbi:MAG: hypothetical protein ACE5JB_07060 [bacterium]